MLYVQQTVYEQSEISFSLRKPPRAQTVCTKPDIHVTAKYFLCGSQEKLQTDPLRERYEGGGEATGAMLWRGKW